VKSFPLSVSTSDWSWNEVEAEEMASFTVTTPDAAKTFVSGGNSDTEALPGTR
jgi:hypothetical protein